LLVRVRRKYRRHRLDLRVGPLEHLYRNDLALRHHPPGLVHPLNGFGHRLENGSHPQARTISEGHPSLHAHCLGGALASQRQRHGICRDVMSSAGM